MRDIKFDFIYKGVNGFTHKQYHLEQLLDKPIAELSDVHHQMELVAKRQYTGLKDKNGVEIYEGDVVRLDRINHKVIYDPAIFRLADKEGLFTTSGYPDWDLCEVIGNIYEHANLLDKDA